jgi:hypothetical protein
MNTYLLKVFCLFVCLFELWGTRNDKKSGPEIWLAENQLQEDWGDNTQREGNESDKDRGHKQAQQTDSKKHILKATAFSDK